MHTASRLWYVDSKDTQGFVDFFNRYRSVPSASEVAAMRADIEARSSKPAAAQVQAGKNKPMRYATLNESASYAAQFVPIAQLGGGDDGELGAAGEVTSTGIGILHLSGYLTKEETFMNWYTGSPAVGTVLADLNLMADDPRVQGVAICVDSPGGDVRGIEELANTIRSFYARCKKRVQAYIDGSAASAAYWAVSGADRIVLIGNSSCVGSIGTMITVADYSEYEQRLGIVARSIYATLSTEKNKPYEEAKLGNDEPMRQLLDKYNNVFIGDVIRGRYRNTYRVEELTPENAPEQFKGSMYFGREAIAVGLADGIAATKDDALGAFVFLLENRSNGAPAAQAGDKMRKDADDDDDDDEQQEDYESLIKRSMQYRKDKQKAAGAGNGMQKVKPAAAAAAVQITDGAEPAKQSNEGSLLDIRPLRKFSV